MPADTLLDMYAQRFTPKQTGPVFGSSSGFGGLRVAVLDQESAELTRAGRRFATSWTTGVTGIAPVQAMPTTAAQWAIGNTSATDTLAFDELGVHLASGTAGLGIVVVACVFTLPVQSAHATGMSIASRSGSARTSVAKINSAVTITTPAAPAWFPIAYHGFTPTAVSSVLAADQATKGKLMVPPLYSLGLAVMSPAGTVPLYVPHASWIEAAQDLE